MPIAAMAHDITQVITNNVSTFLRFLYRSQVSESTRELAWLQTCSWLAHHIDRSILALTWLTAGPSFIVHDDYIDLCKGL